MLLVLWGINWQMELVAFNYRLKTLTIISICQNSTTSVKLDAFTATSMISV